MPIRVITLVNLIDKVNPMPNYTLTIPYTVVLSYTLVLSLQNARNWLYPTIDRLDAFMLIIIPIKQSAVQRDVDVVILQVKGSQLVIRGIILSIVVTKQLKALLARVAAIEVALYYSTWPKEVQKWLMSS